MKIFLQKSIRILRYEGVSGLLNRLRYRPHISTVSIPLPPKLSSSIYLINHTCLPLHDLLKEFLAKYGIASSTERSPGNIALHIGWPIDVAALQQGDIVVLGPNERGFPDDESAISRISLVLDFDPERLLLWEQRPAGQPHRLALPPMPSCGAIQQVWSDYSEQSKFALLRMLFFCGWIDSGQIDFRAILNAAPKPLQLCLSLPETPRRRNAYLARKSDQDTVVDGIVHLPSWTGTAYSYQNLARAALALKLSEVLVFQDDCEFGPELRNNLDVIRNYMVQTDADMFAGIVTDADSSIHVLNVSSIDDLTFVELNKSVGLTFNIFGRRALERLAAWDEVSDQNTTIDRFLSQATDLKVVTCLPYVARHRDDLTSTLWHFSNARYNRMIHTSERRLKKRAEEWRRKHSP